MWQQGLACRPASPFSCKNGVVHRAVVDVSFAGREEELYIYQ